jgi:hypothetical protein
MKDRVAEIAQWVAVQFPEDRLVVRAHGRTLTIAQQEADGSIDPLVRIHQLAPQLFGLSYMRHTGRWEAIPPLQGPWTAIRQALADDPMGLFWFGLHSRS